MLFIWLLRRVDINRLTAAGGGLQSSLQSPTRAAASTTAELQQSMADNVWLANMTAASAYGSQNSTYF